MTKDYQEVKNIVEELLKEAINDFDIAKASAGREVSFSYWFRDEITKALTTYGNARELEGAKEVLKKIDEGVEDYKSAKEMTRINTTGADYIYVYDLKHFVLQSLEKDLTK
jgi:hypothetical protein